MRAIEKKRFQLRRKRRVRSKVSGTAERPRLSVFRAHKNIYAQIIDDRAGTTLVSASSRDKAMGGPIGYGGNRAAAQKVGKTLAARAVDAGIRRVVFDRSGYKYHGRVKELADAVRKGGLEF